MKLVRPDNASVAILTLLVSLQASLDQILWVVRAYLLTFAVLLVTAGRLGAILGQRNLLDAAGSNRRWHDPVRRSGAGEVTRPLGGLDEPGGEQFEESSLTGRADDAGAAPCLAWGDESPSSLPSWRGRQG